MKRTKEEEVEICEYYLKYKWMETMGHFNIKSRKTLYDILNRNNTTLKGYKKYNENAVIEYYYKHRCNKTVEHFKMYDGSTLYKILKRNNISPMFNEGESHKDYKDGNSKTPEKSKRSRKKWRVFREKVFEQDNHKCLVDGIFGPGKNAIHPHHIKNAKKHPELFYDIDNMITLCSSHHAQTYNHEEEFEEFFYELIKERNNK